MTKAKTDTKPLTSVPLYKRAEALMTERIARGDWAPGDKLPNEFELGAAFGVSQGTIRKALIGLEQRGLILRAPGRGTIVAQTTEEEALYAFFRLRDENGNTALPERGWEKIIKCDSGAFEQAAFGALVTEVFEIKRMRKLKGKPFLFERICLPSTLYSGMEKIGRLPSSIYPFLAEKFGITVMRTEEALFAETANEEISKALDVPIGTAVLRIARIAFDLKDRPVELRESWARSDLVSYHTTLTRDRQTAL